MKERKELKADLVKVHLSPEHLNLDLNLARAICENHIFASKSAEMQTAVKELVNKAYSFCPSAEAFHYHRDNAPVNKAMRQAVPDWHNLFKNLVWRGRQQSAMWDMFVYLAERGFIDISCLAEPIVPLAGHNEVLIVSAILISFENLKTCTEENGEFPGHYCSGFPLWWLSIMIVRIGCNIPGGLFPIIECSGIFGEIDPSEVPAHPEYVCDPLACSEGDRAGDVFGEWLPSGLGHDKETCPAKITKGLSRFWTIERLWQAYNGYIEDECPLKDISGSSS